MQSKNVVIKKDCHSRVSLSEIFLIPNRGSNLIYRLGVSPTEAESKPWNICHTADKLSGLDPTYKGCRGFTLIEFLVVVLIIGILAAVALPQYQKAVEKSQASQALILLKALSVACDSYYLEHGIHASSFSQLDFALPWTETELGGTFAIDDTRSNGEWSIQLYNSLEKKLGSSITIQIERIKGKYRGAGFSISRLPSEAHKPTCYERKRYGYSFQLSPGEYCIKLFHAVGVQNGTNTRSYPLP